MTVANFMETTGAAPAAVAESAERLRGWAFGVCKAVDKGIMVRGGKHHLAALRVIRGERAPAMVRRMADRVPALTYAPMPDAIPDMLAVETVPADAADDMNQLVRCETDA